MKPARYDIDIYQGDDFVLPLQITVNGVPKDSTGSTFTAQLRRYDGELVSSFTVTVADIATTLFELILDNSITTSLSPDQRYIWDLQEQNGANRITTWLQGNAIVSRQVTE